MARNEEKHAGRLNRLWLQKLEEEKLEKNPPRPGLGSLHTAADVKKWMPSIKKDIDFYLKQSQVGCYPDRKVSEFSEKIDSLTREYKAYLRKYRELEGDREVSPWTDQPYTRKRKSCQEETSPTSVSCGNGQESCEDPASKKPVIKLSLPVLEQEESYTEQYGYSEEPEAVVQNVNPDTVDAPLVFNWNKDVPAVEYKTAESALCTCKGNQRNQEIGDQSKTYLAQSETGFCDSLETDKGLKSPQSSGHTYCSSRNYDCSERTCNKCCSRTEGCIHDFNTLNSSTTQNVSTNECMCERSCISDHKASDRNFSIDFRECTQLTENDKDNSEQRKRNNLSSVLPGHKLTLPYSDSSSSEEDD